MSSRKIKNVAGRLLRNCGVDIVRYPYRDHSRLRSTLSQIFDALEIDCVLDVGANEGQYGQQLRAMGYKGWILSFEPLSSVLPKLQKAASGDAKWKVFPHALGASDSVATINVMSHTVFSSFLPPDPVGSQMFDQQNTVQRTESVKVHRLDGVLDTYLAGIPNPKIYLKLDTQGFDSQVFEGAEGVLDRILALQTEVSLHQLYLGMKSAFEALPGFMAKGFEIVDFVPVTRKENKLAAVEMDCIMARHDANNRHQRERTR